MGATKDILLGKIRGGEPMTMRQQIKLVSLLSYPAILAQFSSVIMQYIDTAMVTLDSWNHVVGSLVMIKYYTESHDIDTLVAIGVDDGAGRDKYSIISTKEHIIWAPVL